MLVIPFVGTRDMQLISIYWNNMPFGFGRNIGREINISKYASIRGYIEEKFMPVCMEMHNVAELASGFSPLLRSDPDKSKPQGKILWESNSSTKDKPFSASTGFANRFASSKTPSRPPPKTPYRNPVHNLTDSSCPADIYENSL